MSTKNDEDEAFKGLVDEDTGTAYTPPPKRKTSKRKSKPVTKKVTRVRTPAKSAKSKPIGFFKEDGKTKPILGSKPKAKTVQKTRVITKVIPPPQPVDPYMEAFEAFIGRSQPKAGQPTPQPTQVIMPGGGGATYTREQLEEYNQYPVPLSGPIGKEYAPLIKWDMVTPGDMVDEELPYYDYPRPDAPRGMMATLRKEFALNRDSVTQGRGPRNVFLHGPPGTGKSYTVKKLADDMRLPYFIVPATANELDPGALFGHQEAKGGDLTFVEGTLARAARIGGILHIEEWSLLPGQVQTMLHGFLDSSRRLDLQEYGGELIHVNPDLMVVTSFNPMELTRGTPHAQAVTDAIQSRAKSINMGYPTKVAEINMLKIQLGLSDDELTVPANEYDVAGGWLGDNVSKFMDIVHSIRRDFPDIYQPTVREAIRFTEELMYLTPPGEEASDETIVEALHNLTGQYYDATERVTVEQAVKQRGFPQYR